MIPGIDVSGWQGEIGWEEVARFGIKWAGIRATYGTMPDGTFKRNVSDALKAGIKVLPYHCSTTESPEKEARSFLEVVEEAIWPTAVAIDVEQASGRYQPAQMVQWIGAFNSVLNTKPTKTVRFIYSNWSFLESLSPHLPSGFAPTQPTSGAGMHLWLAVWSNSPPPAPEPWRFWSAWQYSSRGEIPGIRGPVDLDLMTEDAFNTAFGAQSPGQSGGPPTINASDLAALERVRSLLSSAAEAAQEAATLMRGILGP